MPGRRCGGCKVTEIKWLWVNDEPSTRQISASPSVFDLCERHCFGVNAELAACSQSPDLREGIEDGCVWNAAATAASVNLHSRATQRSGRKGNGGASHFANFNQTEPSGLRHHIMAG